MNVATVFSGIGAIEHALLRMGLEHKLLFACDNGDVDIFSKKIPVDVEAIRHEFGALGLMIQAYKPTSEEDRTYQQELEQGFERNRERFGELCVQLQAAAEEQPVSSVEKVLTAIVAQENVKKLRLREYSKFAQQLADDEAPAARMLHRLQYTVEVVNDFKKNNQLSLLRSPELTDEGTPELKSADNIDWAPVFEPLSDAYVRSEALNGKKLIRSVRDVAERLGMLHEKIKTYHLRKKVEAAKDAKTRKAIVDDLYKPYESRNQVRKSYLANYDLAPENFYWNVSFLDGRPYRGQVDLFVGGSPCQSFSLVGKQRGLEDTRGTLFYEYARLVQEIQPKVFIYENVRAVLSNDGGRTWETMQHVFNDLGYTWKAQVLNAKDYGIPQNRERLFVVGFRNDLELSQEFRFPEPVKLKTTMKDFLLDNVSGKYYLPKKGVAFVTMEKNLTKRYTQIDGKVALCQKRNQQFNWHGDFVFVEENHDREKTMEELDKYFLSEKVRKYVLATGTKNFYSRPETDLDVARPLLTTMHKMHRAGVDNYVTTEGRLRKLTPRECLRLMGFCDSFKQVVSDTSMYQQAGNSIVVDVLIAIMSEVLKAYPSLAADSKEKAAAAE